MALHGRNGSSGFVKWDEKYYGRGALRSHFSSSAPSIMDGRFVFFWRHMVGIQGSSDQLHHVRVLKGGVEIENFITDVRLRPSGFMNGKRDVYRTLLDLRKKELQEYSVVFLFYLFANPRRLSLL